MYTYFSLETSRKGRIFCSKTYAALLPQWSSYVLSILNEQKAFYHLLACFLSDLKSKSKIR